MKAYLKQYDKIISATGYRTAHDSLPETLKSRVSSNGLLMYRLTVEPDHQNYWFIGWAEIGGFLFFAGLFMFVVFRAISKAPLEASGDPYAGESERFVY